MTAKIKKAKRRKARSRHGKVIELQASVEDDLWLLAEKEEGVEARWNRPRKRFSRTGRRQTFSCLWVAQPFDCA